MPLSVAFVAPKKQKEPKPTGHKPGTCPACGLRSYARMSEREKRVHQQREAVKRRDVDGETLRSIGRSHNVSPQTISRLTA